MDVYYLFNYMGMEKVALNCVKQGMASDVITQITGFTLEEIEKLKHDK